MSIAPEKLVGPDLMDIYRKVDSGVRLSFEDGMRLFQAKDLSAVGYMANMVRERRHGAKTYFVANQHINYTNVCNKGCKFCSFYAKKGGPAPYEMSIEDVRERLNWHRDADLTEIHMVGGINPRLPYQYYMDLVSVVKDVLPGVHVKAFTAIEITEIARQGNVSVERALADLMEAGLDSLPGGGIEILSDRVHSELFGKKLNGEEWKEVARAAAKLGLKQYATMLYGHIETLEERVSHLVQLRELQDETQHFLTMTPLSFHPEATELEHIVCLNRSMRAQGPLIWLPGVVGTAIQWPLLLARYSISGETAPFLSISAFITSSTGSSSFALSSLDSFFWAKAEPADSASIAVASNNAVFFISSSLT